ncbi:MAG: UvrD-helicase domain-containing protein [Bacillota bacterium]|jgi:ATP-dependent helicase/nuclease subunit A|nr:UvrD-helicase domain-containing protein [Bacillota bacterium]
MTIKWTKEQLQAIEYDQPNPLLVSAAAGSGKTAVLIERIFRRVMSKQVEPEELLVATFTDKAAAQMRQKIDQKLAEAMKNEQDPETLRYLRELKRRFPLAQISTIHAFCLNLIREFGAYLTDSNQQLILQPGFSVMSDTYRKIFLDQAIDEVLTHIYEKLSYLESDSIDQQEIDGSDPLQTKDLAEKSSREDVTTSLISSEIPDTQDEIELFSLTNESLTEREWLEDFDRLALMISDSLYDVRLREEIAGSWAKLRSMAYFEKVSGQMLKEFQATAKNFANHPVVEYALDQIESLINPALEGLEFALNSEHMRIVSNKKKLNKEDIELQERLILELEAVNDIAKAMHSNQSATEKWNLIHDAGKSLGDVIVLAKRQSTTKPGLAKLDFIAEYEPKVLPLIALIHPKFNHSSALAKRNHLEAVQPYFIRSTFEIEQDLQTMIGPLARFFETIILVDRRYQKIKRRFNQIDFNDFEHYALRLLDRPEIAEIVHQRYKEIYLDEYQDTNPIQETLISRIKCPRTFMVGDLKQSIYRFRFADPGLFRKKLENFFLFEDYLDHIQPDDLPSMSSGYTILLNRNFRSKATLLEGINELFSWFMQRKIAELEYDETQMLIPGREDIDEIESEPRRISLEHLAIPYELDLLEPKLIPELAKLDFESGAEFELALEALQSVRIIKRELISGRKPADIAVLGRTHRISSIYKKVLSASGIPVSGGKQETFLETPELRFLTQLMSLLDNMQQDIPLASVMRSPIFGLPFDENELLILRLSQPEAYYFHEVIQMTLDLNSEEYLDLADRIFDQAYPRETIRRIYKKLQNFYQIVIDLRAQSKWLSLAELLDNIFRIADYPDYLTGLPFAAQRLADVELFQQWANRFEMEQGGGLRSFIVYLDQITEQKLELEDFNTPPAPSDSVSIMTIHAAKGLEYPVVILAGANQQLVRSGHTGMMSFDPEYGLSSYIVDPEEQVTYSTPANAWHQEQLISMEWAEEYRLLYVAMTRAEEKLYILSNEKMKAKENQDFSELVDSLSFNFTKMNFQNFNSYAKIIAAYLETSSAEMSDLFPGSTEIADDDLKNMLETEAEDTQELQRLKLPDLAMKTNSELTIGNFEFRSNYLSEILAEVKQVNQQFKDFSESTTLDPEMTKQRIILPETVEIDEVERLKRLLPELDQSDPLNLIPAKLTVSEISSAERRLNLESSQQMVFPSGMSDMGYTLRKPDLDSETDTITHSGKEFGSLIHNLMQFLNLEQFLEKPSSKWSKIFQAQIDTMIEKQQLFAQDKTQVDIAYPLIEQFLKSKLAQRLYQAEKTGQPVYREIPFTLAIPASDLNTNDPASHKRENMFEDQTLIQGMIDLWFMEDNQAVLIDYKSDNLLGTDQEILEQLQNRYAVQLKYYTMAIEKIIEQPVKERYIWLFRQGKAYAF